jgi:hypothetical protein
MNIVSEQQSVKTIVASQNQVSEDLDAEPSDAERQAAEDLAADIRSALRRTRRLTIRQLANRWPWYFRGGGLIADLSDDPDDDNFHEWRGITRIGVLALDLLEDERVRQRAPQRVPAVSQSELRRITSKAPANKTTRQS